MHSYNSSFNVLLSNDLAGFDQWGLLGQDGSDSLSLTDSTALVFNSDALPTSALSLAQFGWANLAWESAGDTLSGVLTALNCTAGCEPGDSLPPLRPLPCRATPASRARHWVHWPLCVAAPDGRPWQAADRWGEALVDGHSGMGGGVLNAGQVALLRSNCALLSPLAEQASALFYDRVFERAPRAMSLFHSDRARQAPRLIAMIDTALVLLDDLPRLAVSLDQLGQRPEGYGVQTEHYFVVGGALLDTLDSVLGPPSPPGTARLGRSSTSRLFRRCVGRR